MKVKSLITAIIFVFALLVIVPIKNFAQVTATELQHFLNQEVANKRTKGIVVGIIDGNGKQIFSAGKLSDNNPKKPDGNTMFEIASVTKLFTTLALADFATKNLVNLHEPISTYLPKHVKTPVFNNKEISLQNLASHTSGFPRFPFNQFPNNALDNYTVKDLYEYITQFKPEVAFGKEYKYSNTGMGLIGHILSLQAKKPFEAIVNETICKNLNLENTGFYPTKKQKLNLATGHFPYGYAAPYYNEGEGMKGAGGLYSCVNDLLKFASLALGLENNSLSPAMQLSLAKVGSVGIELGYDAKIIYDYSMGWNIWKKRDKTIYMKDGTSFGFRSFLCIDMDAKKGVVILSNSFNTINDIGLHILDSTYKFLPYTYDWTLLDSLKKSIKQKGVDNAITKYYSLKASNNKNLHFNEEVLHYLANELVLQKKYKEAIKLHEVNITEYPKTAIPLESLGDLYLEIGNKAKALECFTKAQLLKPKNLHYQWVIEQLNK